MLEVDQLGDRRRPFLLGLGDRSSQVEQEFRAQHLEQVNCRRSGGKNEIGADVTLKMQDVKIGIDHQRRWSVALE